MSPSADTETMNAHGLRFVRLLLAPLALVAALALPGHAAAAPTLRNADSLENPLVAEINKLRASKGLRKLRVVPALTKAATRHARSMGESGYFRHELRTPKQSSFWTPFGTWIRWYYAQ